MKHCPIETEGTSLSVAAPESVLEWGSDAEIIAMMRKLRELPSSELAEHALAIVERSAIYGLRHAVPGCIALWRDGNAWQHTGTNLQPKILRTDADGRPAEALGRFPLEIGRFGCVMTTIGKAGLVLTRALETARQAEFAALPPAEKMRFTAARILVSNGVKDFRKIASFAVALGLERSFQALAHFDACYAAVDRRGRVRPVSPAMQLVRQLSEPRPFELAASASGEILGSGLEEFAVCRELGLVLADYLFSPACSLERRLREIEADRAASHPPPPLPPYPMQTHSAQVSDDNDSVLVRKKISVSPRAEIDNPLGPAIVTHSGERYALDGKFLSKAEWEQEVSPLMRSNRSAYAGGNAESVWAC